MPIPSGFIPRVEAQEQYGRSKMSFIRDVDSARNRDDSEFLSNFIVLLKDGTSVGGEQATKEFLRANDSKKPEWYINEKLLKSRYWSNRKPKPKSKQPKNSSSQNSGEGESTDSSSASRYIRLLEATNQQNQIQINEQMSLIKELSENQRQSNVLVKSLTDLLGRSGVLVGPQDSPENVAIPLNAQGPQLKTKSAEIESFKVTEPPKRAASEEDAQTVAKPKSIWKKDLFWFINDRFN